MRLVGTDPPVAIWTTSGQATIRDLGVLNSVAASVCACHLRTSYVSLSMHSVIEKLSGAS